MADLGYIALVVAGLSAYWWRHFRLPRARSRLHELFAPDAQVALHVALHEATQRHQPLSSLHVLYGLLQDEAVTAAIAAAGGHAGALEDRVLDALAAPAPADAPQDDDAQDDDAHAQLGLTATIAHRTGRQATCTDLWAQLGDTRAARLIEEAELDRGAILFALCHGSPPPDAVLGDPADVLVVLRNDHYTTQELVCSVLRELFELTDDQAWATMLAAHTEGRAVVGRFTARAARDKIAQARERARAHASPLWLGVEPA